MVGLLTEEGYEPAGKVLGGDDVWRCCTCLRLVLDSRARSHAAMHKRERVVHDARMEMNGRGVDFQPGQQWIAPQGGRKRRTTRGRRA